MHDVIIVGGGPAGLSAALILGRALRRVVLIDSGEYRNAASSALHGFLTRDGTSPADLRRIARDQLRPYSVDIVNARAATAARDGDGFAVTLADGRRFAARKLLLATGVVDRLPPIPGLAELWGRRAFACPYCDGWEFRRSTLGVLGHEGAELALTVRAWAGTTILFTNNGPLPHADRHKLVAAGVRVASEPVTSLREGAGAVTVALERPGGASASLQCAAIFLKSGFRQRSNLATQLGLPADAKRGILTAGSTETDIPGLYVAGDASIERLLAIQAAAEGAAAGISIHQALIRENLR